MPLGTPLSDDEHLTAIVETARLRDRVNRYWPVAPIEWLLVPPATGLGVCVVATEMLYPGFEWQLANVLFVFSELFDKTLILDADTPPTDLGRVFDDMWTKSHPSHDWVSSEPTAPPAVAPRYNDRDATGARLYVNATWDPTWESESIAPRVSFETSYPDDVQATVLDNWEAYGFEPLADDE